MQHRVMWPIVAVVALGGLFLTLRAVQAQREGERPRIMEQRPGGGGMGGPPGRFVVAHALAERIVILDTVTGQLYVAGERDFKKFGELPKVGDGRPMMMEREEGSKRRGLFKKKDDDEKKEEEKKDPN